MLRPIIAIAILTAIAAVPAASAQCQDVAGADVCTHVSVGGFSFNYVSVSAEADDGTGAGASGHSGRDFFGTIRGGLAAHADAPVAGHGVDFGSGAASAPPPSFVNRVSIILVHHEGGEESWYVLQVTDRDHDGVPETVETTGILP